VQGGDPVSKKRAIQNTLGRLGMQASNHEVVATLAEVGIDVTEGLIRQVRVEMLKEAAKAERQRARLAATLHRLRRPQKMRPRRGSRS
jgi:hypothetical protein